MGAIVSSFLERDGVHLLELIATTVPTCSGENWSRNRDYERANAIIIVRYRTVEVAA
jgi:hypothetical protein